MLGGARAGGEAIRLLIHDSGTLALRDSVFLGVEAPRMASRLRGLADARDGRHLIALTGDSVFRVDAREAEIVARTARARSDGLLRFSPLAVLEDPPRVFAGDPESFVPPSGELHAYDGEALADLGTVTVRRRSNTPVPAVDMAWGQGQERLYVVGGTNIGSFGGFTVEAEIAVVEPREMTLLEVHPIGGYGVRKVFALRR